MMAGAISVRWSADGDSGNMHTVSVTPANASDTGQLPHRLREDDRVVFDDEGYVTNPRKRTTRMAGVFWGVVLKASKQHPLTDAN